MGVVTIQPVYGRSEVGFVPELRDVGDPPAVTGSDVGLVVSPNSFSPCLNDHRWEHLDQVVTGTIHDQVVVETFGSSSLQNGDDRELFPEPTGGGTIDLFVQDIEKVSEVSGTILRGQSDPVTSSVVINPNPLFQGQGNPEWMVPVIDVDPLTDGFLKRETVGGHGFPIKRGDRSSIYKN